MSLDPGELTKLRRFLLAHVERFALALVCVPRFDVRQELQQWVSALAAEVQRGHRCIDGTGLNAQEVWARIAPGGLAGEIVVMTGLDELLQAENSDLARLLNRQRESLARLLPGPVLLLLGDTALDQFLVQAPDLADWYAASFSFEREGMSAEPFDVSGVAPALRSPELSSKFRSDRIALLQQQLRTEGLPRRVQARILLQLANLQFDARDPRATLDAAEQAVTLLRELLASEPSSSEERHLELEADLALARIYKGNALWVLGRAAAAIVEYDAAISILAQLVENGRPGLENDLARARMNKGNALRILGQAAAAIVEYDASIAIRARLVDGGRPELENVLARARMNKGNALCDLGQSVAAIVEYDAAIGIFARLVDSGRPELENDLALARMLKGTALWALGQAGAAIEEYDAAIAILARLVDNGRPELENELALARVNKGSALRDLGQSGAAIVEYDAAIAILTRLVNNGRPELENNLASARMNKGIALRDLGQAAAAIVEYDSTIAILARLVDHGRQELRPSLARAHGNRALAFLNLSRLDQQAAKDLIDAAQQQGMQGLESLASWIAGIGRPR